MSCTYDFETLLERHGHDAIAVDCVGDPEFAGFAPAAPKEGFDTIPLWVADMNFPTAKASHPAFGYFKTSEKYYSAIAWWHKVRKGVDDITPEVVTYENGVLGGLVSALQVFAAPGDSVLLHSPTYMGFTGTLRANGYHIVHSPLVSRKTISTRRFSAIPTIPPAVSGATMKLRKPWRSTSETTVSSFPTKSGPTS